MVICFSVISNSIRLLVKKAIRLHNLKYFSCNLILKTFYILEKQVEFSVLYTYQIFIAWKKYRPQWNHYKDLNGNDLVFLKRHEEALHSVRRNFCLCSCIFFIWFHTITTNQTSTENVDLKQENVKRCMGWVT